ncbi:hypothetical protein NG895_10495 [Aeoliella sp. ICT_H6.2]|uniref:Secreted protein n=1 Tax=Aeoliella straminimaris TaxID=2954799 RepID=A0A9X2JFR4_9BACT|nr:hypothetical protein [Aeoliella straminimaris]MCO6044335.1 hypothetical protein [Aeoliella straminimaris]
MLLKNVLLCLTVLHTAAMSSLASAADEDPMQWYGKLPDRTLMDLAPESDFVGDNEAWKELWNKWNPDEPVPEVDFKKSLVVVATVTGPNRMFGGERVDANGNLTFVAGSTRMAGPGFAYLMRRVSREGVKTVNGHPVPAVTESQGDAKESTDEDEQPAESITVKIVGTLETGLMAIGGETTGTTITANGITMELDLTKQKEPAKTATSLQGKRAIAVGSLRSVQGVERANRWVVTVTELRAAAQKQSK